MNKKLLIGLIGLSAWVAQAQKPNIDLINCRFGNGIAVPEDECLVMRRFQATEDAKAAQDKAFRDRINAQYEADLAAERTKREQDQEANAAARARQDAAQLADQRKWQTKADADEKAYALGEAKATAAAKAKCGADYKAPRIGMPITRAQECVTSMRVTAQLNRADGVVTTYQGGGAYFHVMNGLIVSWGR